MAKKKNDKITYRQLQMLEMKAEGKTYKEIGAFFDITGTGAQQNTFVAACLLKRYGVEALPDGSHPDHSLEELINAVPKARDLPLSLPAEKEPVRPLELRVTTPLGDIIVGVKADSTYPGIYIDLKGPKVNDEYSGTDGSAALATVEFDPGKGKIQSIIYGNGNSEEYTHLVEHKNITKEKEKPSLSQVIQNASARAGQNSKEKSEEIDLDR